MTPEERQMLSGLFDRVRGVAGQPRDRDAEAFIADAVRAQPYAPYVMAQTVIVQEQTLNAASARIEELEARVRQLEAAAPAPASSGSFLGGIGKSIFGGAAPTPQAAPSPWSRVSAPQQPLPGGAPGYAPQAQQPAPWQQPQAAPAAGGSFLKTAAGAAVGVAGGMMLANSLSGMFGGHHNSGGFGGGASQASGGDSLLDRHDSPAQAALSDQSRIDDGLPGAQQASYDDSSSGYGDDSSSSYSDDSTDV